MCIQTALKGLTLKLLPLIQGTMANAYMGTAMDNLAQLSQPYTTGVVSQHLTGAICKAGHVVISTP